MHEVMQANGADTEQLSFVGNPTTKPPHVIPDLIRDPWMHEVMQANGADTEQLSFFGNPTTKHPHVIPDLIRDPWMHKHLRSMEMDPGSSPG
ncbi:hypothetical protein B9Z38_04205 [Limnohabitans sp. MMS-10A-160]|nr:hypothetical protein B9Z43_01870 [Limnohabitans sp. MMS-10A-192]PUE25590.1 hypothetical protein B9Z38_04205 [Limnohabitans sp. MMS-10A-160]